VGREVAILQDLGGPKIRTGALEGGRPVELRNGDELRIVTGTVTGRAGLVSTSFEGLARAVRPGDRLLVSDGVIELTVERSDGREIQTTVTEGGTLKENQGIAAPGVALDASAITPKDESDLRFGISIGVDLVAVSFVRTAADLRKARQLLVDAGSADLPLVAKLERPEALEDLDAILGACEAVMVARGDLGLQMPLERVPRAQKMIAAKARSRSIPVIVATQVLESMRTEPRPTRAEVSDAAHAVAEGVDAIMLAGETAIGAFPSRAVQTLDAIIREAEAGDASPESSLAQQDDDPSGHERALCKAAVTLADSGRADAIVAVTREGRTAGRLSALRPRAPILAVTNRHDTARRMLRFWGIVPVFTEIGENVDEAAAIIRTELIARKLVAPGATVVLVSISHDLTRRDANYLKIQQA
jgi:pyruvate kinase